MAISDQPLDCGCHVILRPWFHTKTGKIVYAWQKGKRVFAIWIRCELHKHKRSS